MPLLLVRVPGRARLLRRRAGLRLRHRQSGRRRSEPVVSRNCKSCACCGCCALALYEFEHRECVRAGPAPSTLTELMGTERSNGTDHVQLARDAVVDLWRWIPAAAVCPQAAA